MFRILQIIVVIFLGQISTLWAQGGPPQSIYISEFNELTWEAYTQTKFSARFEIGIEWPDEFPMMGGLDIQIPFDFRRGADGFSLAIDSREMTLDLPSLFLFGPSAEIPKFSCKLQASENSGALIHYSFSATATEKDEKGVIYINPAIWESALELLGKITKAGIELAKPQDGPSLAEVLRDFIENPESDELVQQLITASLDMAFKDAKMTLVNREDGVAYYTTDVYKSCATATKQFIALFPWEDLDQGVAWEEIEGGTYLRTLIARVKGAKAADIEALFQAAQSLVGIEMVYDFKLLPARQAKVGGAPQKARSLKEAWAEHQKSGKGPAGDKVFVTGGFVEFSGGKKEDVGSGIETILNGVARIVSPDDPAEFLAKLEEGMEGGLKETASGFLYGMSGKSGGLYLRLDDLDFSSSPAGSFDFTEAARAEAQDVSSMIQAYLPMMEMALQQELGTGAAASDELEF